MRAPHSNLAPRSRALEAHSRRAPTSPANIIPRGVVVAADLLGAPHRYAVAIASRSITSPADFAAIRSPERNAS